jgi:hypothetical protein
MEKELRSVEALRKLPIGMENFVEIRRNNFYYVDKTRLIEQLVEKWSEVSLFTRPRRFGKSLNMSMLRAFFEVGAEANLFDGLYISHKKELCEQYMGKYPVISFTLKNIEGQSFDEVKKSMRYLIGTIARQYSFLLESEKLSVVDKEIYRALLFTNEDGTFQMSDVALEKSLYRLTELLEKHYHKKVIVLIDEYDVPLEKAFHHGYYDEMVILIRNLFGNVLKTNEHLKMAVLTGCLRIAKESIFTGLNNFKVYPITMRAFDESFGFTDEEVQKMLKYYRLEEDYEIVKAWYDGYHFGDVDVYCPWDVINYCSDRQYDPKLEPQNYWANTSSNDIISHFVDGMGGQRKVTRIELERLINGETVQKEINQELTYKELYSSIDNLWSTLFMTGYLTQKGDSNGKRYNLAIPNQEIRNIMTDHILQLFKEDVAKDGAMVETFCQALVDGNANRIEQLFTEYLMKTISVRDTFVRKPVKENFYHGILLGILSYKGGWYVTSNRESGDGFSDIMVRIDDEDVGIIIEVKYAENGKEEEMSRKALLQIHEKHYEKVLLDEDIHKVMKYGIACNKKKCKVSMEISE